MRWAGKARGCREWLPSDVFRAYLHGNPRSGCGHLCSRTADLRSLSAESTCVVSRGLARLAQFFEQRLVQPNTGFEVLDGKILVRSMRCTVWQGQSEQEG